MSVRLPWSSKPGTPSREYNTAYLERLSQEGLQALSRGLTSLPIGKARQGRGNETDTRGEPPEEVPREEELAPKKLCVEVYLEAQEKRVPNLRVHDEDTRSDRRPVAHQKGIPQLD